MLLILIILFFVVLSNIRRTKSKIDYLESERKGLRDADHIQRNEAVLKKYRDRLQQLELGLILITIAIALLIVWLLSSII